MPMLIFFITTELFNFPRKISENCKPLFMTLDLVVVTRAQWSVSVSVVCCCYTDIYIILTLPDLQWPALVNTADNYVFHSYSTIK